MSYQSKIDLLKANERIAELEVLLDEAATIIHGTPVLMIDIQEARRQGEDKAIGYTEDILKWSPRARAFLAMQEKMKS